MPVSPVKSIHETETKHLSIIEEKEERNPDHERMIRRVDNSKNYFDYTYELKK